MFKLQGSLSSLFAALAQTQRLYLPQTDARGQAVYAEWRDGAVLTDAGNTLRSAKDFFFPQTQNLVDFKLHGKQIEIVDNRSEAEDFLVFGVRACDVASFDILDRVFLSEPVDSYYETRRAHCTVVSLACEKPEETCFCSAFGIDLCKPGGDVRCTKVADDFYFEALTEKGEVLLASNAALFTQTDGEAVARQSEQVRAIYEKLPLHALKPDDFASRQAAVFDSPVWAQLSRSCLGCGSCTFVCPTCQCYDIQDFDTGHGVKRLRCWDSCMYSDFTKMAAANPRPTQLERFRQRFMHKLVYFPQNNDGVYGCVGCGRCLKKCPISMNIVKVMKALGGEEHDG